MTFAAIAGYDPKDPYTWDVPVPDYVSMLSGDIGGIKVGVIQERVDADVVETDVRNAVVKAISVLGELGATVQEVELPLLLHSAVISSIIIGTDVASLVRSDIAEHLSEFDHNNQVRLLTGSIIPAMAQLKP